MGDDSIDMGYIVTLTTGMSVRPKAQEVEDPDPTLAYTQPAAPDSDKVGRCRLTASKPALLAPMVSALEATT